MQLSTQGAIFLRTLEGFSARYYLDPGGVGTIGTGFTWASAAFRAWWEKNKSGVKFGPSATITRVENDKALAFVFDSEYGAALISFLAPEKPVQHVYDGAGSVVFNCGPGTLTDRWAAALKAGDLKRAAALLKTTRTTQKGKKLRGLVSRRLDEAELIELHDYAIGRPARVVDDAMTDGVLERGERGRDVMLLQERLTALGFYAGELDGRFGFGTEAAVMEFQQSAGLKDDGFAGTKTLAALDKPAPSTVPIPTPVPRNDEQTVRRVQEQLRALGYPEVGQVDGKIGTKFKGAVLAFREDNNLPLVAEIDDGLLVKLATASPRPISTERATATAVDLKDATGVQQGQTVKTIGAVVAGAGGIGGLVDLISGDRVDDLIDGIGKARQLSEAVFSLGPWVLLAIGGGAAFYFGRKIISEQVTAYRENRHT